MGIGSASEGLEDVYRILGKVVTARCDEPFGVLSVGCVGVGGSHEGVSQY